MRQTEPEPAPPLPRDAVQGLQPDEMASYLNALAEWGSRGWQRVLDWQERETQLGGCKMPGQPAKDEPIE